MKTSGFWRVLIYLIDIKQNMANWQYITSYSAQACTQKGVSLFTEKLEVMSWLGGSSDVNNCVNTDLRASASSVYKCPSKGNDRSSLPGTVETDFTASVATDVLLSNTLFLEDSLILLCIFAPFHILIFFFFFSFFNITLN